MIITVMLVEMMHNFAAFIVAVQDDLVHSIRIVNALVMQHAVYLSAQS